MIRPSEKVKKIIDLIERNTGSRVNVMPIDVSGILKQSQEQYEAKLESIEQRFIGRVDSIVYKYLEEIGDRIEAIEKQQGDKGEPGEPGIDGQDADEERVAREVLRRIKLPRDGKDVNEEAIVKEATKRVMANIPKPKDGDPGKSPDEEAIKENVITELKTDPKLVDYIKDLVRNTMISTKIMGGGGARANVKYHDLTSLCDGSAKSFAIPSNKLILGVYSTQFPMIFRPIVDWTGSGTTTLTLTSEVGAPASGQTLYILYVE